MTAIVVLGMHRSGTSCLAGMLAAGGIASAGDAIRNWDNARGHHEMLDVVRLNEAVLAHSGGHYLSAPASVRWTDEHAAIRDRLLAATIDRRPALLKDPRTLLVLPFWRASRVPFRAIGIVRHPLAVARSLEAWREMPLADGVSLWLAHNRALAADRARHGYRVVDFEQPKSSVVAAVRAFAPAIDLAAAAAAYEQHLVHHDAGDVAALAGLAEAVALYRELAAAVRDDIGEIKSPSTSSSNAGTHDDIGEISTSSSNAGTHDDIGEVKSPSADRFPREAMSAFANAADANTALASARAALAAVTDAAAVLVPVVTALVRRRWYAEAGTLIVEHAARLDAGLGDLLHGKVLLAAGDAAGAVRHLEAACAVAHPMFQARHLLPQALRAAGRLADARAAMRDVARLALYPHGPLATLAEWTWLDGDRDGALDEMQRAIEAAPLHRRGRLRTRCAEWLLARGDREAARTELQRALAEDPAYVRAREVLATLDT